MRAEVLARLRAPLSPVERRVVLLAPLAAPLGLVASALAARAGLGPPLGPALGWSGCALALLLVLGTLMARVMSLSHRVSQELAAALPLAALTLVLGEKVRWVLGVGLGWTWARGPRARELLGPDAAGRLLIEPGLALPLSVLGGLWVFVAWLRIERGREVVAAREAAWAERRAAKAEAAGDAPADPSPAA